MLLRGFRTQPIQRSHSGMCCYGNDECMYTILAVGITYRAGMTRGSLGEKTDIILLHILTTFKEAVAHKN